MLAGVLACVKAILSSISTTRIKLVLFCRNGYAVNILLLLDVLGANDEL